MEYTITDSTVAGRGGDIRVRDYAPAVPTSMAPYLWVHGGGFALGGLDQKESDAPARYLAATGRRVRTIAYRLAPNPGLFREPRLGPAPGRFPAAHHDVIDVAVALGQETGASIGLGGASAGGNLVAGAIVGMKREGVALPSSLVLVYGAMHGILPENSEVESSLHGVIPRWAFNPAMVGRVMRNYLGSAEGFDDPRAFPGGTDVRGYPPTLTLDATNDRLRKSGHAFHEELQAAGVTTEELVVEARHGFLGLPKRRAFATGMRAMSEWLIRND